MKKNKKYSAFLEKDYGLRCPEEAAFCIFQAPYEKNVSYGCGTSKAPAAIIEASQYLEIYGSDNEPAKLGIYTAKPIKCMGTPEQVINEISKAVSRAFDFSSFPVLLGGEHTVSCGMAKALFQVYGAKFGVVHFDSHCDLRSQYYGNKFSHACAIRRIIEDYGCRVFQIATRAYSKEEDQYRKSHNIGAIDADEIITKGIPEKILPPDFPDMVYISFDVDALDPSIMPSTGTPEPGGILWHHAIQILRKIADERRIIAFDIVELAPIKDLHHADYCAAKLAYEMMKLATQQFISEKEKK